MVELVGARALTAGLERSQNWLWRTSFRALRLLVVSLVLSSKWYLVTLIWLDWLQKQAKKTFYGYNINNNHFAVECKINVLDNALELVLFSSFASASSHTDSQSKSRSESCPQQKPQSWQPWIDPYPGSRWPWLSYRRANNIRGSVHCQCCPKENALPRLWWWVSVECRFQNIVYKLNMDGYLVLSSSTGVVVQNF